MGIETVAEVIGKRIAQTLVFLLGFFIVKGTIKKSKEKKCQEQQ